MAVSLRRFASWSQLAPSALLVGTQALWYTIPALGRSFETLPAQALVVTALWINAAHGLQYLWITSHFAKREGTGTRLGSYLLRALMAGSLLTFAPGLLLAPTFFGPVSYDAGLALLVASVANLHHFILDGAIWKLRDGAVARVLLRASPEPGPERSRSWLRPWVYAAGAVGLAVSVYDPLERHLLSRPGLGVERTRAGVERLAWIGREPAMARLRLGKKLANRGRNDEALVELQRSNEVMPNAETWKTIGLIHLQAERLPEAAEALERALELAPQMQPVRARAAEVWFAMARDADPERAEEFWGRGIGHMEEFLRRAPRPRCGEPAPGPGLRGSGAGHCGDRRARVGDRVCRSRGHAGGRAAARPSGAA